jgi:hypothetical protein
MVALGKHASTTDRTAGMIDFFFNLLDKDSQQYMADGLARRENMIPAMKIVEILEWMIEEWTGRPFPSASGSTSSPSNGGRKSTRATPRQTSSASALTAS